MFLSISSHQLQLNKSASVVCVLSDLDDCLVYDNSHYHAEPSRLFTGPVLSAQQPHIYH